MKQLGNYRRLNFRQKELELLIYGLSHSIPPKQLRKTKVFTTFDMIHRFLRSELSRFCESPSIIEYIKKTQDIRKT